jgi:hypothetical protein
MIRSAPSSREVCGTTNTAAACITDASSDTVVGWGTGGGYKLSSSRLTSSIIAHPRRLRIGGVTDRVRRPRRNARSATGLRAPRNASARLPMRAASVARIVVA